MVKGSSRRQNTDRQTGPRVPAGGFQEVDAILTTLQDGFLALDRQLRCLYANEAAAKLLGRRRDDLIGRAIWEALPEGRGASLYKNLTEALLEGIHVESVEYSAPLERSCLCRSYPGRDGLTVVLTPVLDAADPDVHREQFLERQAGLVNASMLIMAQSRMEPLLQTIADAARNVTGASLSTAGHGYIGGQFTIGAASRADGLPPCPKGSRFGFEHGGVYLEVIEKGATLRLTDEQLRRHPRWRGLPEGHVPLRGLLAAPLFAQNGTPNGMILVSHKAEGEFGPEEEAALSQLAAIASLAMQNLEARQAAEEAAEQARRIARFPEENPDPVVRIAADCRVLYRNQASAGICAEWQCEKDHQVPPAIREVVARALAQGPVLDHEIPCGSRTYSLNFMPVAAEGYVNVYGRDVTERKQAKEALQQSERRFRATFENAAVGVAQVGLDGRFLRVNQRLCEITGYPVDRLLASTFQDITHPEDLAGDMALAQRLHDGRIDHYTLEKRYVRPDGEFVWVGLTASLQRDDQGEPEHYIAVIEDITDRRRVQEDLRRSETLYRSIARNFPNGAVYIFDHDLRFLVAEGEALHAIGLDRAQLEGRTIYELDEETWRILEPRYRRVLAGESLILETPYRNRVFLSYYVPIRDGDETVSFGMVIAQDITEIRRGEQALRESEARLRAILDHLPLGVWFADSEGRINYGNEAARSIWAGARYVGPEEFGEYKGWWYDSGEPIEPRDWAVARAVRNKEISLNEVIEIECFDGTRKIIRNSVVPVLDDERKVLAVVSLNEDITERIRADQALRDLTEDLERQVALRTSQLAATVAQLRRLTLELSQAEEQERKRLAEILHDDLQQLLVGAKFHLNIFRGRSAADPTAVDLVDQVVALIDESIAKSRSLSHELSPPVLYQSGLCDALEWLARQVQTRYGFAVHLEAAREAEPASEALKGFLYRAAQEMVFNAVKHSRVQVAVLRLERVDGRIRLTVADEGRGFDPGQLGQGFGLFSIQERIGLLGGALEVDSSPGGGSRFVLTVPEEMQEDEAPTAAHPVAWTPSGKRQSAGHVVEPASSGRFRVVLADDHKVMREGLARLLAEEPDIEVVGQATNGRDAVNLALEMRPDVVVMDVAMPVIDGEEATRQIRRQLPNMRVIALSMFQEAEMADRMTRAGAEMYLSKAGASEVLLQAIRAGRRT